MHKKMLEKEIKILDINVEDVKKRLEDLGAEKTFEGVIHDVYYDFPDNGKNKMEENKRLFRVRKKWEIHLYTIKRKRTKKSEWWEVWYKIADEGEKEITNIESFKKVIEWYWMKKIREKKKHRISYSLSGLEFDIDKYDLIPSLLEIEGHTVSEIEEYIKKLWLENNIKKDFGSRWLYEHYWLEYTYL